MITLTNVEKNGSSYVLGLTIDLVSEVANLPTSTKQWNRNNYATSFNYGTPAANSYAVCKQNGKTYLYTSGAWVEAGRAITLETLNATENKTYTPTEGHAYNSVVVNVPAQ